VAVETDWALPGLLQPSGRAAVGLDEERSGLNATKLLWRVGSWRGGAGWRQAPKPWCSCGFPRGCPTPVAVARSLRFQLPPVEPCVRFSRTRLTDVVHRGIRSFPPGPEGSGCAATIPLRLISPSWLGEAKATNWSRPRRT
jgi:hypothetical protein